MKEHNWIDLRMVLVMILVPHIMTIGVIIHEFGHALTIFMLLGYWPAIEYDFVLWFIIGGRTWIQAAIMPPTEVLWIIFTTGPVLEMIFYLLFIPVWKRIGKIELCFSVIPLYVSSFIYLIYESSLPLGGATIMPSSIFVTFRTIIALGVAIMVYLYLGYKDRYVEKRSDMLKICWPTP